ncbi:MAG: DEAD/DEAH box helicase family protein [Candidatus Neomarinimicrobiota bacterium]
MVNGNLTFKTMTEVFNQEINSANLRECQYGAYDALLKHFSAPNPEKHVLVQLPTGTGKSALIAIAPFSLSRKKVLVLTPNLLLAEQLADDLDFINNPNDNIYKKLEIFSQDLLDEMEIYTLRLENTVNFTDIEEHQIIVSNYQQFGNLEKWFKNRENLVDLIIIDEAHHQKANTYQEIINFFKDANIISLTATPFRSDGKEIEGKKIYTYHFSDAIKKRYIRNINISNVSPQQITLTFSDQDNHVYSLEDIMRMKEEAWFRKGIALSQDCCDSIAQKANEKLLDLKTNFPDTSHQIIASAISIRHAREFVKPAFEKLGLKVGLVSSEDKKTNKPIKEKLKQGKIDVIVHIGMLGEGFDHKKLGVAAIFRPYASLNPYIQFIGRVIRNNENTEYCWVVSHLGLNQMKRFDEFKMFDNDDQKFLQDLLSKENGTRGIVGEDTFMNTDETDGESEEIVKIREIGGDIVDFESQFVKDEGQILDAAKAIDKLSESERARLFDKYGVKYDSVSTKKRKRIKPVDNRKAEKNFLNEKAKSITTDIINQLGLGMHGRDFNPLKKNFVWVQSQISRDINKKLGIKPKERNTLSNQQLEDFKNSGELEIIKNNRTNYFRDKLSKRKISK